MTILCTPSPTGTTGAYLVIDGTFTFYDLFVFQFQKSSVGRVLSTAYMGNKRPVTRYFKENFTIEFPLLTQAQYSQLRQLVEQLSPNDLHTIQYVTPGITYLWDNATLPAYATNTDVNRLRGKILIDPPAWPHLPGYSNLYSTTLVCAEA